MLLNHASSDGRILAAHARVLAEQRFDAELFERWYCLFVESVDSGWTGPAPTAPSTTPPTWPA